MPEIKVTVTKFSYFHDPRTEKYELKRNECDVPLNQKRRDFILNVKQSCSSLLKTCKHCRVANGANKKTTQFAEVWTCKTMRREFVRVTVLMSISWVKRARMHVHSVQCNCLKSIHCCRHSLLVVFHPLHSTLLLCVF